MSNRQIKTASVTFEPVAEHKPSPPSGWLLLFGVFFPAAVIAIELATKLCAQSLFDPMPTYGHVAAVAFVPACNFLIWTALARAPAAQPEPHASTGRRPPCGARRRGRARCAAGCHPDRHPDGGEQRAVGT